MAANTKKSNALDLFWGNTKDSKKTKKRIKEETIKSKKLLNKNDYLFNNITSSSRKKEANYIMNVTNYPIYENETIDYFETGEKYYQDLLEELKKAKEYILMEFFIISEGKMWNEIYEILKEKQKENVKIYLIYDSLGSLLKKPKHLKKQLEEINVKYLHFNPLTPVIRSYINYRDHRKIVVIDGICAYTGGINIGDEYININSRLGIWKDCGVKITGEGIKNFIVIFFKFWNVFSKDKVDYKDMIDSVKTNEEEKEGYIIPYSDNPQNKYNPSENTYINIINHAKKYVYITTPYLILDTETTNATNPTY